MAELESDDAPTKVAQEIMVIVNPTLGENSDEEKTTAVLAVQTPRGENGTKPSIRSRIKGVTLVLITSLLATTHGAAVKYLNNIPTGELILIIGLFSPCLFCVLVTFQGVSITKFAMKKFVLARVFLGMLTYTSKVWSFQYLPLGNASALVFTAPLFACVMARVFLKEKLTLVHVFAMSVGLCGIVLIAKPTFIFPTTAGALGTLPWYYNMVPLLSALGLASAYTVQRRIGSAVSSVTISFYMMIAQLPIGAGYQTVSGASYQLPPCYIPRFLFLLCALCLVIGSVSINLALSYESVGTVALIRNLDTALAFFVQVVMFGVPAEALSLVGTALIMTGTVCLTLSKMFNITCGRKF